MLESGRREQRLRQLPARVVVYFVMVIAFSWCILRRGHAETGAGGALAGELAG
ncbi:hypothetical protein E1293_40280 [Actinomadura darangshiensis]|uniref:Uncharacterized protein n=1 Tax=Actinomadura darangshiensis TaxID=705336 RepID=A0A4R5A1Y1_9ACTN|nr:hypothetical protein E1293_40280 [Actinomadura darangshiensis]